MRASAPADMRIAISTGGGDAPGLNAVIRAVVLSAHTGAGRSYGIQRGYEGLLSFNGVVPLGPARGPRHHPPRRHHPGHHQPRQPVPLRHPRRGGQRAARRDRSDDLVAAFQASGFDALVSIGGDGSLQISHELWRKGLPVVCVPKTIDNDVSGTQRTFGFDTAVSTATEALDKLHSTAESHDRVMVVELMGRYAGWIALYSGLSGSADVILLPEIPFDMEKVCEKIQQPRGRGPALQHRGRGRGGAARGTGRWSWWSAAASGTVDRLGGIASKVARDDRAPHRQGDPHPGRWGTCSAAARRPPTTGCSRSASAPRRCGPSRDGAFGIMVGLNGPDITRVPLDEVVGRAKIRSRSTATPSAPRASSGSAWVTELRYPPTRTVDAVELLHGESIPDPYRWLEDGADPATREWTERQNALTEALPRRRARPRGDPPPARRAAGHRRRSSVPAPVARAATSTSGATAARTSRCSTCATGWTATIASWWIPTRSIRPAPPRSTGTTRAKTVVCWPTACPRTAASRACSTCSTWIAAPTWPTGSPAPGPPIWPGSRTATGFYYTRYPAPGEVPEGEEHYHRAVYFHALGTDPAADPLVFQPARKEYWPGVSLSPDGRWLLIGVARTFDQTDLYLAERRSGAGADQMACVPVAEDLPASFEGELAHGRLFLRTNLDAPTYRLYVVDPEHPARGAWREIVAAAARRGARGCGSPATGWR